MGAEEPAQDQKYLVECNSTTIGASCDSDDALCTRETCQMVGADVACVFTGNELDDTSCESDGDPCTADRCAAGGCVASPLPVGTSCNDGETCTTGETCDVAGVCGGGNAVICPDDGDPCTNDACTPDLGCGYAQEPVAAPCGEDRTDAGSVIDVQADAGPSVVQADASPHVAGEPDAGAGTGTDDGDADVDPDPTFNGDLGGGGCQVASRGSATDGLLLGALALVAIILAARRRTAGLLVLGAGLAFALAARSAHAQGLDAQIFQPATSSSGYLTQDGALVLPAGRYDVGLSLDFARDMLVMRDADTGEPLMGGALVSDRLTLHLTGGVGLFGFLELGADLPVNAAQNGDLAMVRPGAELGRSAPGDLRLAAKAHVFDAGAIHLAVVAGLSLPTGSAEGFSGNDTPVFSPKLVLGVNARAWSLALNAGYRLRGRSQVANLIVDDELIAGLAIGVQVLPARLWLVGEAYAAAGVQGDGAGRERPAEVDLGARLAVAGPWSVTGGVGFGVGNGYGAPSTRAIFGLAWTPRAHTDRPLRSATWTPPDEPENENEPESESEPEPEPELVERDHDSVADRLDRTNDGDANADTNADTDGDGIIDAGDTCPEEAETMNGKDDDDGCPDRLDADTPVRIVAWKRRLKTLPAVRFELGKAPLRLESHVVLDALADYLMEHPEIERLRIEVHTDDQSNAVRSVIRSRLRADNVRRYLEQRGIAADRLESAGFGPYRPVAPNDTAQHRNWNRRVDFIIVKKSPSPSDR